MSPFLDLGLQPWCNDFVTREEIGKEKRYPLNLHFCHDCSTVQVTHTVPKEIMYQDHLYLSGVTKSMKEHFEKIAHKVHGSMLIDMDKKRLAVDIGSNDGTLLSCYADLGMKVLGIEPCIRAATIAQNNGIRTEVDFFDLQCANKIVGRHGKAQVISAANVFYHVEELHGIVRGIKHLLDGGGVFVMQGSYLPRIIEKKAFDIMYHEHLLYYRIDTLRYLLSMYDLEIFDVEEAPVHGGSIVAYIGHKGDREVSPKVYAMHDEEIANGYDKFETYCKFAEDVKELRDKIREFINSLSPDRIRIFAYGAPAKGTVLLNYCGFTNYHIVCAAEKNKLKVGRYIPGTGIPIVSEEEAGEPEYYLLLSWNFIDEFCKSEEFLSGKRKFIVPIPEPRIVQHEECSSHR